MMIKLFDLRDLATVRRLVTSVTSLHVESALIQDFQPIRSAVAGMLMESSTPTYVWKAETNEKVGFVQLRLREDGTRAQLIRLGAESNEVVPAKNSPPPLENNQEKPNLDVWLPLLDQLAMELGQRGVQNLVADVNEVGVELPILRRAGFAVYTREDIWKLTQYQASTKLPVWQPRRSSDDWDIHLLYANLVPRLIQLVEPSPPVHDGMVWVLREANGMTAFVQRHDGPTGSWLRFFIHPDATMPTEKIIESAVQLKPPSPDHPLYCGVPRYQSWLRLALQKIGFAHWGSHAVMVKHTVKRVQIGVPAQTQVIPAKGVAGTAPFIGQKRGSPKSKTV